MLREELKWRNQVHAPHDKPIPPWTAPFAEYDDWLRVRFVKDWRPESQAAVAEAFKDPEWEQAKGVSAAATCGPHNRPGENPG